MNIKRFFERAKNKKSLKKKDGRGVKCPKCTLKSKKRKKQKKSDKLSKHF